MNFFKPEPIPASQRSNSSTWFYSPVDKKWLDRHPAAQHFSFGSGTATVASTLIVGFVGTAASVSAGLPGLAILALTAPAITVHGIVHMLRRPWKQINHITCEALYSWLLEKDILISNNKELASVVRKMEAREFSMNEKERINFKDDNGKAYTLYKDYADYAWQVKEVKPLPTLTTLQSKTITVKKHPNRNPKQLTWNNELQSKYRKLEEQLTSFHSQNLTPEEQHVIERINNDLDDLAAMTEALRKIAQPSVEDIRRLHRILNSLEAELNQIHQETALTIRKALEAKENFINERSLPTRKYLEIN